MPTDDIANGQTAYLILLCNPTVNLPILLVFVLLAISFFLAFDFQNECIVDTVAGVGQFHYFRGVYIGYGHSPYLIVGTHRSKWLRTDS